MHVLPLIFSEFMQSYDGDKHDGWTEYVMHGGMPLAATMRTDEQKMKYLKSLFEEVYLKDIIERNHVTKTEEFENLIDILASAVGSLTNPAKIETTFESVLKSKLTRGTTAQFIEYLKDAFLVVESKRYGVKGRRYIGSPKKYYFEDVGLRNARLGFRQVEESHLMENVIYNELRYRGFVVALRLSFRPKELRLLRKHRLITYSGKTRYVGAGSQPLAAYFRRHPCVPAHPTHKASSSCESPIFESVSNARQRARSTMSTPFAVGCLALDADDDHLRSPRSRCQGRPPKSRDSHTNRGWIARVLVRVLALLPTSSRKSAVLA